MFGFLKAGSFWVWLAIASAALSGTYLLGREAGREKEIERWAGMEQKRMEATAKALMEEQEAQVEFVEQVEPIIQQRIVYRDRIVKEYENIVVSDPDSCLEPTSRVSGYNAIVSEGNVALPALSDE